MRIAICDDENNYINKIEGYIEELKPLYKNLECDCYYNGEKLLKIYTTSYKPYDIIFIDIEMDGINGITTANSIRNIDNKVIIIYITSHSEYVYECFDAQPLRFLIKPVDFKSFSKVFHIAYEKANVMNKPFHFSNKGIKVRLYCEDIIYFESFKRQMIVHTSEQEYDFYSTIDYVHNQLPNCNFLKPHKSFLINMKYIKEITQENIKLYNDILVPLSKKRKKVVYAQYLKYLEWSNEI